MQNLKEHIKLHQGIYRYHCPYCGKGFSATWSLRGHMATHTGVREFKCDLCGKEFFYKQHLNSHLKLHGKTFNKTDGTM